MCHLQDCPGRMALIGQGPLWGEVAVSPDSQRFQEWIWVGVGGLEQHLL